MATSVMASVIGVFGALLVAVLAMMWRSIADLGTQMRQFGDRLVRLEVEVRHLTTHLQPYLSQQLSQEASRPTSEEVFERIENRSLGRLTSEEAVAALDAERSV